MDRAERLLSRSTRASRILEIGPGYNPIAPKADGWNTHVVDHADRETLRNKFHGLGVDAQRVEEVDTVWHEGALHEAVPAGMHGTFDAVIASHLLEHIPDPVGFLASAAILCRPAAAIALALPDQRFCFDYFQPHSTTGDVLAAHFERRSRHSFAAIWNQFAYSVRLDGAMVKTQETVRRAELMFDFSAAAEYFNMIASQGPETEYRDAHGWIFTPAGFALTMLELGRLGVVDWRIDELHPTEGCEFITFLRRGVAECGAESFQHQRLDLLTQRLLERKEQVDFAVAGGLLPGMPATAPGAAPPGAAPVQHMAGQAAGLAELRAQIATHVDVLNDRAREIQALAPLVASVADLAAEVARQRERLVLLEQVLGRITTRLAPFSRALKRFSWRPSGANSR